MLSEQSIVDALYQKLSSLGLKVYKNVVLPCCEVDVIAVEGSAPRPLVYVFEVKTRVKPKLVKQVFKRFLFSDYVYVVVPYKIVAHLYSKVDGSVGIVVYYNGDFYIYRFAKLLGNGYRLLDYMEKNLAGSSTGTPRSLQFSQ
jgi:hypothetical protein